MKKYPQLSDRDAIALAWSRAGNYMYHALGKPPRPEHLRLEAKAEAIKKKQRKYRRRIFKGPLFRLF